MQKTIRQHFVPQTYLKQWGENNKVFITDVISNKTYKRDCKNIFFLDYMYSIYITLWSEVNTDVKKELLSPLYSYQVYYNNKEIKGEELIDNINSFEKFVIKKSDKEISTKERNVLWRNIINNYSCYIENEFSNLETEFTDAFICNNRDICGLLTSKSKETAEIIFKIYKFAQHLFARNPYNFFFLYSRTCEDSSLFPTRFKYLQINELQKQRHLFPNNLNMNFFINKTKKEFITSDIPVLLDLCIYQTNYGEIKGCFLFPLSPKIVIIFSDGKKNVDSIQFSISYVYNETVDMINRKIKDSCSSFYITSEVPNDTELEETSEKLTFRKYNCRGMYLLTNKLY